MSNSFPSQSQPQFAPPGGIAADTPALDTFLASDVLHQSGQFTLEDIDTILGASGDPAASPAARAASAAQDADERAAIVRAAEIMFLRRARATEAAVHQAMQRSHSPFFLPVCPTGNSSPACPLARRLGFPVHYLWDNHCDQVTFGLRLTGGMGNPRYFIVQGAPPRDMQHDRTVSPYDRHMAAVNATRQLAYELGLSPEIVDGSTNRIIVAQNTLVYCRLDEFRAWWEQLRAEDRRARDGKLNAYVDNLAATGATRYVTPFVGTLGEIAARKAHATRDGSPFIGQVGGSRRQRI